FLDPRPDEPEQLRGAAQCVTDDRFALFRFAGFKVEPYPHMLGPRAAKAQLFRKVAAQRPGDEQQSLAVLDRFAELAVRARKERRLPCHELIGLDASREQDSVPSVATELAFQLTRTDCRDISQRAQSEKIKSLEVLGVERQLTRSNRREVCSSVFHRHQATRPRARRGESRGERAGRETEPRFAPDR